MAKRASSSGGAKKAGARAGGGAPRMVEVGTAPAGAGTPGHPAPVALGEIIGHARAVGVMGDALRSGRVHHAWIFHGPRGVGKFTAAVSLAGLLLDPSAKEARGTGWVLGEGPVADLLRAGSHPDLHVVRKELAAYHEDAAVRGKKQTNIPVDVVRSFMLEPGHLGATVRSESRAAKVFIVDEAELMGPGAQNAVLKFLEEPPDRTVVILVTSSEERLLATIRSRCQRVQFGSLSGAEMERWWESGGEEAGKAERAWLLELAEGSPGVAHEARAGGLYAWQERLGPMLKAAEGGRYSVELGGAMHELVEGWAKERVEEGENASKEAANKAGADWMMRLVSLHWRRVLRNGDAEAALAALDAVREAEREVDANVNLQFVFEKMSSEFAAAGAGRAAG